jgi:hypothetical protein
MSITDAWMEAIEGTRAGVFVMQTPWMWPALEIVHFVGLALLFGAVVVVDLRLMGRLKELPDGYLAPLMRLAAIGFALNAASGVAFVLANPEQYLSNRLFWLKMALVLAAAANVCAYRLLEAGLLPATRLPMTKLYKAVGGASLGLWLGVMLAGRILPFLGGD